MTKEATLLIGVGATTAGSALLHDYLVSHPEVVTSPRKDLHYFDSLSGEVPAFSLAAMQATVGGDIRTLVQRQGAAKPQQQHWIRRRIGRLRDLRSIYEEDQQGFDAYRRYFGFEMARSGARFAADITPAYALLSDEWFETLKSVLPVTRFVYILRDPVDRLWSRVRAIARTALKKGDDARALCDEIIDRILKFGKHDALEHGDYVGTLGKLDRKIPEQSRMVLFFEDMFSQDVMDTFCSFLGLSMHPATADQPSFGGGSMRLDDARRRGLSELLAPQYAAVEARFGTLPDRWQQNMTKV